MPVGAFCPHLNILGPAPLRPSVGQDVAEQMNLPNCIKNFFRGGSVCECAWRTEPGRKHLKYEAKLRLFDLELVPDTPTGGVTHIGLLYCPECGRRIAPLLPNE